MYLVIWGWDHHLDRGAESLVGGDAGLGGEAKKRETALGRGFHLRFILVCDGNQTLPISVPCSTGQRSDVTTTSFQKIDPKKGRRRKSGGKPLGRCALTFKMKNGAQCPPPPPKTLVTLDDVVMLHLRLVLIVKVVRPLYLDCCLLPLATSSLTHCTQLLPRCRTLVHHLDNHHHDNCSSEVNPDLGENLAGNL